MFVVTDASASLTHEAHGVALMRMAIAGAQVVNLVLRGRRDDAGLAPYPGGPRPASFAEHVTPYRNLIISHEAKMQRQ